jgi:lambda family phage portal protein
MQIQEWDPEMEGEIDPKTGNPRKGGWVADEVANDKVESAWWEWRKVGNCDTTGDLSFHEIERLMLRSALRDGHVLCRKVRNWDGNRFRFALQPIESDALDTNYNGTLPNGNIVVMGVEMDAWRRRVAYYILTKHPGDYFMPTTQAADRRKRVDASEIIHLRFMRRIGQTVGVSALAPVMDQLEMLRGYEEAELISARSEACKGGFFYNDMTGEAGMMGAPAKPDGIRKKMVPGQMDILPYGWKYQANNPTHPNGNYSEYRKGVLRGIASGLSCSYNILANDLVGVSYSSLRGGLLDEREVYKMLQEWMCSKFHMEIFEDWLESSILAGVINLPISKFDKFNTPYFQGRRWAWVDPKKDIEAAALAIKNGFASTRGVVAENGEYILDIAKDQKADAALQARYDLNWSGVEEGNILPVNGNEDPDDEQTDTEAAAIAADASVADTALNGIQVQALLDVLGKVGTGELPKTAAKAIIHAAFPLMDDATIDAMLADLTIKEPVQPPPLPPKVPAE